MEEPNLKYSALYTSNIYTKHIPVTCNALHLFMLQKSIASEQNPVNNYNFPLNIIGVTN